MPKPFRPGVTHVSNQKKATPEKKSPAKKPNRPPAGPLPSDDPIAILSARAAPDYDFQFDTAGLEADVASGPTREAAAEVFASEVAQQIREASVDRIKSVDPAWLTVIVKVVLAIAESCPRDQVVAALEVCRDHPRSLKARFTRLALARRLPGHWLQDALEAAQALIATAIQDLNNPMSDLFETLFPFQGLDSGLDPAMPDSDEPIPA
jgi:hypothetical protein